MIQQIAASLVLVLLLHALQPHTRVAAAADVATVAESSSPFPVEPPFDAAATKNIPKDCKCESQFVDCSPPVFLHVPKTGGESIEAMFGMLMNNHMTSVEREEEIHNPSMTPFVISVVRNPYDRAFSWFRYCIHGHHHSAKIPLPDTVCYLARQMFATEAGVAAGAEASEFGAPQVQRMVLRWLQSDVLRAIIEAPNAMNGEYWFTRSMKDFLANADGSLAVDYMVRFDAFGHELEALMADCLQHTVQVLHANPSTTAAAAVGADGKTANAAAATWGGTMTLAVDGAGRTAQVSLKATAFLGGLKWYQAFTPPSYYLVEQIWGADFGYFGYQRATEVPGLMPDPVPVWSLEKKNLR